MTFQEAIDFKQQFGEDQIIKENIIMNIFVVPSNHNDLKNYIADYRRREFSDEDAKQYSSNMKFKVYGLWSDSVDVLYKDLSE